MLYDLNDIVCQKDEKKDSDLLLMKYNMFNCLSHTFRNRRH